MPESPLDCASWDMFRAPADMFTLLKFCFGLSLEDVRIGETLLWELLVTLRLPAYRSLTWLCELEA